MEVWRPRGRFPPGPTVKVTVGPVAWGLASSLYCRPPRSRGHNFGPSTQSSEIGELGGSPSPRSCCPRSPWRNHRRQCEVVGDVATDTGPLSMPGRAEKPEDHVCLVEQVWFLVLLLHRTSRRDIGSGLVGVGTGPLIFVLGGKLIRPPVTMPIAGGFSARGRPPSAESGWDLVTVQNLQERGQPCVSISQTR
jgi:hypothetical protein